MYVYVFTKLHCVFEEPTTRVQLYRNRMRKRAFNVKLVPKRRRRRLIITLMSSDLVFKKQLLRNVALIAAANRARVRVVAGVGSNMNSVEKSF